ncbi:hypothetical protein [Tunicatimonas pelagia]|uniref:hypothetical protein n=1 Tax=Tunicatimonas pelagia TaxID=931531 RepID=UPI002665F4D7|nr:hypothetical protein [Tunicatimonas pelagia]WKN43405.1 hypothetical protein P0M28_00275 [Tunicatimonas pelagia]
MQKSIIYLLVVLSVSLTACYDDEFDTGGFSVPSLILFDGGFPQSTNPLLKNRLVFSSIDDIEITVSATNINELQVTAIQSDGSTSLGRLPIANEEGVLQTSWSELGNLDRIDFTGAPDSKQPYTKRLELTEVAPFTLDYLADGTDFVTPSTTNNDSTVSVYYELATANTPIASVSFAQRIGEEGEFAPLISQDVNATSLEQQQVSLTVPDEATLGLNESLFVRATVEGVNGLTYEEIIEIQNLAVALAAEGEFDLTNTEDASFNFAQLDTGAFANEQADVRLAIADNQLNLEADPESGTTFVVSEEFDFASATYQSVRDAFAAGTAVSTVEDIANLPTDVTVLVQVGSRTGPAEYAVLQLNAIDRVSADASSVSIRYKAN